MLEAIFISGVDEIKVSGLTQWDRGQVVQITCPDLPSAFQVHFAKRKRKKTIDVQAESADNVATVAIPDELLQEPFDLYAYLYFDEGLIGETVKTIRMPIKPRVKPDDYVIDLPQEQATDAEKLIQKMMDEYVEAEVGAVTSAAESANTAKAAAAQAQAAADSVQDVSVDAQAAKAAKEAAETANTAAQEAKTAAQASAQEAKDAVASMGTSAEDAANSAKAAAVSETNAKTSENAAETAKEAAETARDEAVGANTSSAENATKAETAAKDAKTSATNASASATSAEQARQAIENMIVEAVTLTTGNPATVSKSLVDGVVKLVFGLPNGAQGDKGDPGSSIKSIARTSGNSAPGTYDTYTITLTDETTTTFQVYNGKDGEGAGDMTSNVYDPRGKKTDVFAYVDEAVKGVKITTDAEPTEGSTNPVQSGGVYSALAEKQPKGDYALRDELPSVPVQSVNGKTGAVVLNSDDVGARPNTWTPNASEVGADPSGTAESKVSNHNTATDAHNDIRLLITELTTRFNALANSTDVDLDQLAELVAYIKDNRSLIEQITTNKVNVSDIIDNLTTNVSNKPLSAAQGVALKALIDAVSSAASTAQSRADAAYSLAESKAAGTSLHFTGTIGTSWTEDATTGAKYQTVMLSDANGNTLSGADDEVAIVDCTFEGSETSADYAAYAEQQRQFLAYITNGFARTVAGGIRFVIFGDANTVEIPFTAEVS